MQIDDKAVEAAAQAIYRDAYTADYEDRDGISMEYCRSFARAALEAAFATLPTPTVTPEPGDVDVLVERLESHMGKQDISILLQDCRLAATALRTLSSRLAEAERERNEARKKAGKLHDYANMRDVQVTELTRRVTELEAALKARGEPVKAEALDWVKIAKAAGAHGVRYTTNQRLVDFLNAIRSALVAAPALQDGWVAVPCQPYPEMIAAWWRQKNTGSQEPGETGEDRSDYAAYRAMLAARPAAPLPVRWRTIDSAPKDGTDIILGSIPQMFQGQTVAARVTVGHWTTEEECRVDIGDCGGPCHCREYEYVDPSWISWDGGFTNENPATHWMPLPAAPSDGGSRG